jgi:hypothetical protein
MHLYVRPLPADLAKKGAYFYPFATSADGDVRVRYRVVDNDHGSVTLASSVVLGTDVPTCVAPTAPVYTGSSAGPIDLSSGTKTVLYTLTDGVTTLGSYTLTSSLSGAATTMTALAADLNTQELTRAGAASLVLVTFTVSASDHLVITAVRDFGARAILTIGNGGLNTKLGLVNGATATGTNGTICRLQWRQEMGGGVDGNAGIADADYEAAWDVDTSPLKNLVAQKTGLLTVGTPGVTSAAAQAAMLAWVYATNGFAVTELPDDKITESAAIAWHEANLAIGDEAKYSATYMPSYGKRANPYGTGLYVSTLTGAILGLMARKAVDNKGYHLAPAGTDYGLASVFKSLTTGDTVLNNDALNGYGLNEARKRGAAIYLWGDRTTSPTGRDFIHKRKAVSHIGRVLLNGLDQLVFKANDDIGRKNARRLVRALFGDWFRASWFDDSSGTGQDDQVTVKVDLTNNPTAVRNAGDMAIDVAFDIVDTTERVVLTIGPKGVSEAA